MFIIFMYFKTTDFFIDYFELGDSVLFRILIYWKPIGSNIWDAILPFTLDFVLATYFCFGMIFLSWDIYMELFP